MLRSVTFAVVVCAGSIIITAVMSLSTAHAAVRFRVIPLTANVGSNGRITVNAINDRGQVVGTYENQMQFEIRGLLWSDPHQPAQFVTGEGDDVCAGIDINNSGVVVGSTSESFFGYHWIAGTNLVTLPNLANCCGNAEAINDSGAIVGQSNQSNGANRAAMWVNGVVQNLGALENQCCSTAYDINDNGVVVGESVGRVVRWVNGSIEDLGTLGGISYAYGVNNAGDIVGTSALPDGLPNTRPFIWHAGVMAPLPLIAGSDYGSANSINDGGDIVGTSGLSGIFAIAVMWRNGSVINLQQHAIDLPQGWSLEEATDINSIGQITVNGVLANHIGGALLNPIPPVDVVPDGIVNIDDLLAVINAWGACPAPASICAADVDDNGHVDIDDLLAVIMQWG